MRRDEERERSLISDGEDNNNTKKKDTFFFAIRVRAGTTTRHGWDEIYLFLSLSLSL